MTPMSDDSPERRLAKLEWEIEKLAREGWSNEEMQAVLKDRTSKPRGRRPIAEDEERIALIKGRGSESRRSVVSKISNEISDQIHQPGSIADRLRVKSAKA